MSCPGCPIGVATSSVSELQCPAVTTKVGLTSVPVHWKSLSIVTCAT
jgi:hypothetical protein